MFVNVEQARELAKNALRSAGLASDRLLMPLIKAQVGKPVLVRDLYREPSYWLVPFIIKGRAAGFARVLGNGKVAHIGAFYHDASKPDEAPKLVTLISSSEARRLASKRIRLKEGETLSEPVFVHDGPIGREAWLIEVLKNDKPTRWIFITSPPSIYERPAGEMPGELG